MEYINAQIIERCLCNTQQITFEVTEKCNLQCYYCGYGNFYSDRDKRNNRNLKTENAINFLCYIKKLWLTNLNDSSNRDISISFYGGEPLMNIEFIQIVVEYIEHNLCDLGRVFKYSMTTNAILLDRYIDYLVKKDFDILISLDGDEYGSSYRVFPNLTPAYKTIIDNIDRVKNRFPDFYDKKINFNSVLHNRNSVEDLYSYFKHKFGKNTSITELNTSGILNSKIDEFNSIFKNHKVSLYDAKNVDMIETELGYNSITYKNAALYLVHYSEFKYDNYNELLYDQCQQKNKIPTGTCLPFAKKVFITVSGKILPCERIGHQYALGYIDESGISINFDDIANKYNTYYMKVNKLCKKCYVKSGCTQCVFFIKRLDENRRLKCDNYMSKDDFDFFEQQQIRFFSRHPEAYSEIMNNIKIR